MASGARASRGSPHGRRDTKNPERLMYLPGKTKQGGIIECFPGYLYNKINGFMKSRHSGENRSPKHLWQLKNIGFRLPSP
jgi:hypothetical protein